MGDETKRCGGLTSRTRAGRRSLALVQMLWWQMEGAGGHGKFSPMGDEIDAAARSDVLRRNTAMGLHVGGFVAEPLRPTR